MNIETLETYLRSLFEFQHRTPFTRPPELLEAGLRNKDEAEETVLALMQALRKRLDLVNEAENPEFLKGALVTEALALPAYDPEHFGHLLNFIYENLTPFINDAFDLAINRPQSLANYAFRGLLPYRNLSAFYIIDSIVRMSSTTQIVRFEDQNKTLRMAKKYAINAQNSSNNALPRSKTALHPGDLLFRDLNISLLGAFGHVAMYIGAEYPQNDIDDHLIIEMKTTGCEVNTVKSFLESSQFWGAYRVPIGDPNLECELVGYSLRYVGHAQYARFWNYKNNIGQQFRCDGFIEHCFEWLIENHQRPHRLVDRGGLCENDTWYSLSPQLLRNATMTKLG